LRVKYQDDGVLERHRNRPHPHACILFEETLEYQNNVAGR